MKQIATAAVLGAVLAALLTACGSAAPAPQLTPTQLTPTQREDQFWTAYQQRLGLTVTTEPIAKTAGVKYGHLICDQLSTGMDRDVLTSQLTNANATAAMVKVQVATAVEFLCPPPS